jgi:hypothetical protein
MRRIVKAHLIAPRLYKGNPRPNDWELSLGGERAARERATYHIRDYWVEVLAECGHYLQRYWIWHPKDVKRPQNRGKRRVRCEKCRPPNTRARLPLSTPATLTSVAPTVGN